MGHGQRGCISLLGQRTDLPVCDTLLSFSPAVRTGNAPEGGPSVSEVDNLDQSPLKTCHGYEGWQLNLWPGKSLKS